MSCFSSWNGVVQTPSRGLLLSFTFRCPTPQSKGIDNALPQHDSPSHPLSSSPYSSPWQRHGHVNGWFHGPRFRPNAHLLAFHQGRYSVVPRMGSRQGRNDVRGVFCAVFGCCVWEMGGVFESRWGAFLEEEVSGRDSLFVWIFDWCEDVMIDSCSLFRIEPKSFVWIAWINLADSLQLAPLNLHAALPTMLLGQRRRQHSTSRFSLMCRRLYSSMRFRGVCCMLCNRRCSLRLCWLLCTWFLTLVISFLSGYSFARRGSTLHEYRRDHICVWHLILLWFLTCLSSTYHRTFQLGFILSIIIGLGVGEAMFGRFASHAAHFV